MSDMLRLLYAVAITLFVLVHSAPVGAFSFFDGFGDGAARWADGFGLEGGIDVSVESGFEFSLGAATPGEEAQVRQAVIDAFAAWENSALSFNISFDQTVTTDPTTGAEIDVLVLPGTHPIWPTGLIFGLASMSFEYWDRTLTNGTRTFGGIVTGADIYLHQDAIAFVNAALPDDAARLAALTRLMIHEIGHTIGIGHPVSFDNWDTDTDPFNVMSFDPANPESSLIRSSDLATDAIMLPRPCGLEFVNCPPIFYTTLTNDDMGARDFLYLVVPEPTVGILVMTSGLALVARSRRRKGSRTG